MRETVKKTKKDEQDKDSMAKTPEHLGGTLDTRVVTSTNKEDDSMANMNAKNVNMNMNCLGTKNVIAMEEHLCTFKS